MYNNKYAYHFMKNTANGIAAVFIDGDNISSGLFETVYDRLQASYSISLTRVYGDYSQPAMAKWHDVCRNRGFEQIQCANSPKKNSTDLKLIDDIYFNLYENQRIKTYIIVSNDRDYTFVVQRLKSKGKKVLIVGHNNTPLVYKNLADEFICLKSDKQIKKEEELSQSNLLNQNQPIGKKRKRKNKKSKEESSNNSQKTEENEENLKNSDNHSDMSEEKISLSPVGLESPKMDEIDKKKLYKDAEGVVIETLMEMGKSELSIGQYKKLLNKKILLNENKDVRLFFLPFGKILEILEFNFSHLLEIRKFQTENQIMKILIKSKELII